MVSPVIVVADEGVDLGFEIAGEIIVFQQDAVFERLVPTLDFALGLRVVGAPRVCFMPCLPSHLARSPEM